jgi:hypothetical protein
MLPDHGDLPVRPLEFIGTFLAGLLFGQSVTAPRPVPGPNWRYAMAFLARSAPPPPKEEARKENFPGKLCLLCILAAAGLFYSAIFLIGPDAPPDASAPAQGAFAFGRIAQTYPVVVAGGLILAIIPGLMLEAMAKRYLFRLFLVLMLGWAGLFAVSEHPAARAVEKIQETLSMGREFPETIRGH